VNKIYYDWNLNPIILEKTSIAKVENNRYYLRVGAFTNEVIYPPHEDRFAQLMHGSSWREVKKNTFDKYLRCVRDKNPILFREVVDESLPY